MQSFDEWLPMRVAAAPDGPMVEWFRRGDIGFEHTYFADTVRALGQRPFNMLFRQTTTLASLDEIADRYPPIEPSGFIFHVSRCGSTLVSRSFAALPHVHVLSEPTPIDDVLRLRHSAKPIDDESLVRSLRSVMRLLARYVRAEQRHVVVKLDAWHARDLALFERAFPATPWIFLYRDPLEVVVSHARVPSFMMAAMNAPSLMRMDMTEAITVPPEEYRARAIASIARSVVDHDISRGHLVNYTQLPDILWEEIAPHFGIDLTQTHVRLLKSQGAHHAKNPMLPFVPDGATKTALATREERDAIERWARPVFEQLESMRRSSRVGA